MPKPRDAWQGDSAPLAQNPFAALSGSRRPQAPTPTPDPPNTKTIRLPKIKSMRIDRKNRGGKTVTVVMFHGTPDEAARTAWLKFAKRQLGIGGALENEYVILQGDQLSRLKELQISGKAP